MPRLIFIAERFTDDDVQRRVLNAAHAGVRWVHLRDHSADDPAFRRAAKALISESTEMGTMVTINGRLSIAREFGTHLHVGRRGPSIGGARVELPEARIGYSAHTTEEAAISPPPDYFFFSPVFRTKSKPGHPGAGIEQLRAFCRAADQIPVYALGGITPERVEACLDAGAYGIAVSSGIMAAENPAQAVHAYKSAVER